MSRILTQEDLGKLFEASPDFMGYECFEQIALAVESRVLELQKNKIFKDFCTRTLTNQTGERL